MAQKHVNIIFATLLGGAVVTSLLQTALTTALPAIMNDLSLDTATAQWLTSAFSLTIAIIVPATAFLIKRFTTRQIFISAMLLFTLGTLICWFSPTFALLLFGRILQALGSGILLPLLQVVVMTIYPSNRQGFMMGLYGLAASAAPIFAPTLAGLLVDSYGWRSIFLITLIPSAITLLLSFITVKNVSETVKEHFDSISMILCAIGMTGLLLGLGNITSGNMLSIVIPLLLGIISLICFTKRQLNSSHPFLKISLFANQDFTIAVIISVLLYAVMIGGSTIYPLLIQTVMGKSAMVSALVMLPGSLGMMIISPIAGKIYDKYGINKLVIYGSILLFISCLGVSFISSDDALWLLIVCYFTRLIAVGCIMMTIVTWGIQNLAPEDVSDGTAILTSLRTLGGALGAAIFAEILSYASHQANNLQSANYYGTHIAFIGLTLVALVLVILAVWVFGRKKSINN